MRDNMTKAWRYDQWMAQGLDYVKIFSEIRMRSVTSGVGFQRERLQRFFLFYRYLLRAIERKKVSTCIWIFSRLICQMTPSATTWCGHRKLFTRVVCRLYTPQATVRANKQKPVSWRCPDCCKSAPADNPDGGAAVGQCPRCSTKVGCCSWPPIALQF